MDNPQRLRFVDYLIVAAFGLILFGYAGFSGRPLTMHEARLPETSREMKASGEWLLPHSGIRPWLERPPLPHWVVIGSMMLFQRDDLVWVVRLPSAIMGVLVVLLTVWMSSKWFGREVGILSGLVLATSFKFYQYATLAEDDIYLAAMVAICMALFVRSEFFLPFEREDPQVRFFKAFFTNRRREFWAFFVVLGLSNLTKGPLLGIIIVGSAVGTYLLWNAIADGRWSRLSGYVWLWGLVVMLVIGAAWPLWAYHVYPDVLDNWKYDYLGRMSGKYTAINEPWYYYFPKLGLSTAPWTPMCLLGLIVTATTVFRSIHRSKPRSDADAESQADEIRPTRSRSLAFSYRLIWCWALAPLIVLSIPKGKHDHYLVPFLAPWAMLAALGLMWIARAIRLPPRVRAEIAGVTAAILLIGYCAGATLLAAKTDHTVDDTEFLIRARAEVPDNALLLINGKLGPVGNLDFFRIQFYSRPDAILLHNLSYLRSDSIKNSEVYVVTRARDEDKLRQLGAVAMIDQSKKSHEIETPEGRFSLFKLTFNPNLQRYPEPDQITSLQAMERDQTGPWCGPPL